MKLMLVEENKSLRRLLRAVLRHSDAEICECAEGTEAVSLSALEHPDWIVLDVNLARTDGLQVLAKLHAANPQAQVILITDEESPQLRARALAAGATQLLDKESLLELPPLLREPVSN